MFRRLALASLSLAFSLAYSSAGASVPDHELWRTNVTVTERNQLVIDQFFVRRRADGRGEAKVAGMHQATFELEALRGARVRLTDAAGVTVTAFGVSVRDLLDMLKTKPNRRLPFKPVPRLTGSAQAGMTKLVSRVHADDLMYLFLDLTLGDGEVRSALVAEGSGLRAYVRAGRHDGWAPHVSAAPLRQAAACAIPLGYRRPLQRVRGFRY